MIFEEEFKSNGELQFRIVSVKSKSYFRIFFHNILAKTFIYFILLHTKKDIFWYLSVMFFPPTFLLSFSRIFIWNANKISTVSSVWNANKISTLNKVQQSLSRFVGLSMIINSHLVYLNLLYFTEFNEHKTIMSIWNTILHNHRAGGSSKLFYVFLGIPKYKALIKIVQGLGIGPGSATDHSP